LSIFRIQKKQGLQKLLHTPKKKKKKIDSKGRGMHQYQSFAPQTQPTVAEYAFPSVLQFLQSEWRRFERDRNEWDIEKAEMKVTCCVHRPHLFSCFFLYG